MNEQLPPVAPDVVAAAVESLTSRLRKKLDAATEQYAAVRAAVDGDTVSVGCGEDAVVTLTPGPSGTVTAAEQARCTCLLAPRCLHRAAVLGACPVADAEATTAEGTPAEATAAGSAATPAPDVPEPVAAQELPQPVAAALAPAQIAAAAGLWSVGAAL
ncbi:SWIM zinc finger family protein, partial [Streptomyces sp. SID12488]|uniref:SWIM zinc finger family protein n=1 Tax=Streptomyces sp. SID12488 TaxID=2706040 RepID=UPI0013FB227F